MAQGQKRTPEEITNVLTAFAITDNLTETSRRTGIPYSTCKDIINRNKDTKEFASLRDEKREQFATRANRIIFKGLTLLEKRYEKALEQEEDIDALIELIKGSDEVNRNDIAKKLSKLELNTLSEITTSMGTLFDKMRVSEDKPTDSNKIDVTVTVVK